MSFTFLSFRAVIIHHAEARLCWYCCPDINFILPSRLLFLHVLPLLLQSVLGIYYRPGNWHNLGFPTSCVPDPRISNHSSISILWNGPVRCGTYSAQAGFVLAPTWGISYNWIWTFDGHILRHWSTGICHENSGKMDAWEVWHCWPQPPTIPCTRGGRGLYSLPRWIGLSEVAGPARVLRATQELRSQYESFFQLYVINVEKMYCSFVVCPSSWINVSFRKNLSSSIWSGSICSVSTSVLCLVLSTIENHFVDHKKNYKLCFPL